SVLWSTTHCPPPTALPRPDSHRPVQPDWPQNNRLPLPQSPKSASSYHSSLRRNNVTPFQPTIMRKQRRAISHADVSANTLTVPPQSINCCAHPLPHVPPVRIRR